MAAHFLDLCKALDRRMLPHHSPLRQFLDGGSGGTSSSYNSHKSLEFEGDYGGSGGGGQATVSFDMVKRIEDTGLSVDHILDNSSHDLAHMLRCNNKVGGIVLSLARKLPNLGVDASIQPITRGVLRVKLVLTCEFDWSDRYHGTVCEPFWIWIEDNNNEYIYHSEYFLLKKNQRHEKFALEFTIPIREPLPSQYYVRVISDRWVGCHDTIPLSFKHLILPNLYPPHTDLYDLHPIPITALKNPKFESLYNKKLTHFNPIQTQMFHTLYHKDGNILVGAPTGSGRFGVIAYFYNLVCLLSII